MREGSIRIVWISVLTFISWACFEGSFWGWAVFIGGWLALEMLFGLEAKAKQEYEASEAERDRRFDMEMERQLRLDRSSHVNPK